MSQAKQETLIGTRTSGPGASIGLWVGIALIVIAGAAGLWWVSGSITGNRDGAAATALDPFLTPAAVEFRASERGLAATAADPFLTPAAAEFRASERGLAATAADPFLTPAAAEFRRSERQLGR